jgi:hypothetical protein
MRITEATEKPLSSLKNTLVASFAGAVAVDYSFHINIPLQKPY